MQPAGHLFRHLVIRISSFIRKFGRKFGFRHSFVGNYLKKDGLADLTAFQAVVYQSAARLSLPRG
jgi:hypothetical protein